MSKLTKICYRLFEFDQPALDAATKGETHDFAGEVALTFEDGRTLFVSWVGEPVQYAIGTKDTSYFLPEAALTNFDVSGSAIWSDLIGREVSLQFAASDNQVLEISSAAGRLLLCSLENGKWWAAEVTVCKQLLLPYDH
ncbi:MULTISPECIES: hypothetical protein [unclassified Xanthomonas]|uniref:hypothetical protein n=1 Tax=Xanthomonas sp. LMG 9002 TaxID=1591158 RepID=UPI0013720751|nr:hypothetical protein [Xanthomonas sp. LMG 9002]MXV06313.1 hypothetical protein [Xanthomonas sp. LMG 9002]